VTRIVRYFYIKYKDENMEKRLPSSQWTRKLTVLFATLSCASAFPVAARIQGSVHDFSGNGWSGGEICNVCHTPHNANVGTQGPLWNHQISTVRYQLYSSPTMNVAAEQPLPGGLSRMCLSCHDGTVAIDSFGGTTGSTTITGNANLGTDLSNDHPIGIEWIHQTQTNGALSCTECHALEYNPATMSYEFVGTPGQELKFFDRKVECPSCHDVHNTRVMDVKLLRKPLAGSQLCLQCHPK
jgi:predicted CXXCH cytochrome family protein